MSWLRPVDRWFIEEVLPHGAEFRRRAARLCGPEEAEDLVHEAYARLMGLADHRTIGSPRAFVRTIIHNLALERFRRARVVPMRQFAPQEELDFADPTPDPHTIAAGKSELAHLQTLVSKLPSQCRRVIEMRKFREMSPLAIAEELSISVSTVEKHLAKGLAILTVEMRKDVLAGGSVSTQPWPARRSRKN